MFGKSIDSLVPDTPFNSREFLKAFDKSLADVGKRRRAGLLRFWYMFDSEWTKAIGKVHAFVDIQVKRALQDTTPNEKQSVDEPVPARYILLHEMAKEVRDPRYQVIQVFLPAKDTTSIAVSNCLFHLARNPHIWTQLRQTALPLGPQPLTFETFKSLILFRHVLFETIRLQGPSGRVLRIAIRDTILPVGGGVGGQSPVFVRKGTIAAPNLWALHHDRHLRR